MYHLQLRNFGTLSFPTINHTGAIAPDRVLFSTKKYSYVSYITKTRLYNTDLLIPYFYSVKLGFTGVYISFLISAQKHRLWVLVRTALLRQF